MKPNSRIVNVTSFYLDPLMLYFVVPYFLWLFLSVVKFLFALFCLFLRESKESLWQVDLDLMEVIFDSLIEYLQLESAYNIFILNPKRVANVTRYGYRSDIISSKL